MSSLTPNLGLIVWSGSDQFDESDLATNWNTLDDALAGVLSKVDPDTLAGVITVTGTITFGATESIPFTQVAVTDSPSDYKGVRISGMLFTTKANATDTAFGVKTNADATSDDGLRLKIRSDGRIYFGSGSAQDIVLYRDAAGSVAFQTGSDIDTANPTGIVAGVDKMRKYDGPGLSKQNLIWNPDFEIDNAGWSTSSLASVTAAVTSITSATAAGTGSLGAKMGTIVAPGSATNEGVVFPVQARFAAGTQYNIRCRVYSAASTADVQIGMANSGVVYTSTTAQALSSTWTEITLSWTPVSTVDGAYFFVRLPNQASTTFAIDEVKIYVGSAPVLAEGIWPLAETFPRWAVEVGNITPVTTQQYVVAIPVEKGTTVNRIHLLAGSTVAAGLTAAEAGLYSVAVDGSQGTDPGTRFRVTRLAQSPNLDYFTYQGPYAPITWSLASPYKFGFTGLAYIGFVFTGTTPPSLAGRSTTASGLYSVRGYHWYPLIGTLSTGVPISSNSLVGYADPSGIGGNYPYAWLS
jgi:hypothetical protein